jgi:hypothetical protein
MTTYKIVRGWRDHARREVIAEGLTLAEAQAHCRDPETSSRTASDPDLSAGPWFDGYERE